MLTVAIVGAGFSGAVLAVQLMRHAQGRPLRVVLVNRSGAMARGLAYGTHSPRHLLNVPAGNMSALADDAEDFLRYLRWADARVQPQSFVPRRLYGSYLEALLDAQASAATGPARLERWQGQVVRVDPGSEGGRARVALEDGRAIEADHVVLAFGHLPPADPPISTPTFYGSPRYVRDPWAPGALEALPPGPVLLIGTGLTAVDVSLTLTEADRPRPVWCLSRRGLVPAPHRELRGHLDAAEAAALVAQLGGGVRSDLRAIRRAVRAHEAQGGDWRNVIGALRAHTPAWWRMTPLPERRRFLRRLQPFWDVARHRCAPQAHAAFTAARENGQVQVLAGRLRAMHETADGATVRWTPRGTKTEAELLVAAVVNCTGASADLRAVESPLLTQLLADGHLQPDPLGLGVSVDEYGALVGTQGRATPGLHYIGPLLRARDWEATAVPELRSLALRMAQRLLAAPGTGRAGTLPARATGEASAATEVGAG